MNVGNCRLCGACGPLCESHILPAFVRRWLKDSSLGHLRSTAEPNRRIQDGPKEYWLCRSCEDRLSRWETSFADGIFKKLHEQGIGEQRIPYDDGALKFAVSVSWRVLSFLRDKGGLDRIAAVDRGQAQSAATTWVDFMFGRREHPGEFEQHLVHLDAPSRVEGTVSPLLNRYLLRAWDLDLISSAVGNFTYAKLGRIAIFGFLGKCRPRAWKGTKLHVRRGVIDMRDCSLPAFLPAYWNDRADAMGRALANTSSRQREKVAKIIDSLSYDTLIRSEAFRAVDADARLSGPAAFEYGPTVTSTVSDELPEG